MNRIFLLLVVIGSVLYFPSCGDNITEVIDLEEGVDYFPLEIGRTLIYEVDSINFITDMLGGKSFYEASNNKVRDEEMWINRFEKYFTPSSWDGHQEVMEAIKETKRTLKENN